MYPVILLIRLVRSHFLIKLPVLLFTTAFFQLAFLPWPAAYMANLFRCTLATLALQMAVALPSVFVFRSEKFFDLAGLGNFVLVAAVSLGATYRGELPFGEVGRVIGAGREVYDGVRRGGMEGVDWLRVTQVVSVGLGEAWEKMRAVPVDWSQLVINGIVVLWALRVGTYTFVRSILRGGDSRFDGIRENRTRFLMAFLMQALWVWFCTLPIVAINTLPAEPFRGMWCKKFGAEMLPIPTCYIRLAWFALGIWSIVRGSAIELLADWQLSKWMWDRKMKRHDEVFCKRGLWLKCRHPNYYGEVLVWLGISICCSAFLLTTSARYETGLGSVTMAVLCFLSGFFHYQVLKHVSLPLIENKYDRAYMHRKDYRIWRRSRSFRMWLDY